MKKSMGKRTRRFGAGGETNPDENAAGSQVEFSSEQEEWLGGADRTDPYILARMRKAVPDKETPTVSPRLPVAPAKTEPVKVESFESGFTENAGLGTSAPYKDARLVSEPPTSVKKPKPKPKVEAKPAPTTNEDVKRLREIDKPLEKVTPEENLIPGGALKGLAALSSRLIAKQAAKAGDKAFKAAKDITPGAKLLGKEPKRIGYDPKKLTMDRSGAKRRAESSGGMKGEFDPKDLRFDFKKGGRVKSASARADGCAIRGKTRA